MLIFVEISENRDRFFLVIFSYIYGDVVVIVIAVCIYVPLDRHIGIQGTVRDKSVQKALAYWGNASRRTFFMGNCPIKAYGKRKNTENSNLVARQPMRDDNCHRVSSFPSILMILSDENSLHRVLQSCLWKYTHF